MPFFVWGVWAECFSTPGGRVPVRAVKHGQRRAHKKTVLCAPSGQAQI